jgi:hypothetical protein
MNRNREVLLKQYLAEQFNKEREEKACAECFLSWYNRKCGVNYTFERAEKVFPELINGTRWEFVATLHSNDNEWCAIEVKGLIRPQTKRQFVRWNKVFERMSKELCGSLQGEFLVVGPPSLELSRSERSKLEKVLSRVISANAGAMKSGDSTNLGPDILAESSSWPFTPDLEVQPPHRILKVPDKLYLCKISDSGYSVEIGMSPPDTFSVEEAIMEAIDALFDPARDGVLRANEQLALARAKGAKRAILLLDCRLPWHPNEVRQLLANKDLSFMSNLDLIYLVKVSQKRISKVWPPTKLTH